MKKSLHHPSAIARKILPVSGNIVVADGEIRTIRSLIGDAHVGMGAILYIYGSCYGDVVIDDGGSLTCSSLTGDVNAGNDTKLVVRGSCYGNVDIGRGGHFRCSSLTGDVDADAFTNVSCDGSCYGDIDIGPGGSFSSKSLTGDVRIRQNAKLNCKGSLYGDVGIDQGGVLECMSSLTGNIRNKGGCYRIRGSFHGKVKEVRLSKGVSSDPKPVAASAPDTAVICSMCGTSNAKDASECKACGFVLRAAIENPNNGIGGLK